jgi:hypothetical protein
MTRKQPYLIWMATALVAVGCHRANGASGKNDTRHKELSIQFQPTIRGIVF